MTVSGRAARGKVKGSDGLQHYTDTDTSRNLGLAAPDEKPPTGQRLSGQPGQQPVVPQNGHAVSREILTQRNAQPPLQGGHWPSGARARTAPRLLHPGHTGPRRSSGGTRDIRGRGSPALERGYLFTSSRRSKCSFLFTSHLNEQDWKHIHGAYEPGKAGPHNEQGHLQWVATP